MHHTSSRLLEACACQHGLIHELGERDFSLVTIRYSQRFKTPAQNAMRMLDVLCHIASKAFLSS